MDTACQNTNWHAITLMAAGTHALITIELRAAKHTTPVWQRRIHDRGLRTTWRDSKDAIHYVLMNPVRAGLAAEWEEWPYYYVAPGILSDGI